MTQIGQLPYGEERIEEFMNAPREIRKKWIDFIDKSPLYAHPEDIDYNSFSEIEKLVFNVLFHVKADLNTYLAKMKSFVQQGRENELCEEWLSSYNRYKGYARKIGLNIARYPKFEQIKVELREQ